MSRFTDDKAARRRRADRHVDHHRLQQALGKSPARSSTSDPGIDEIAVDRSQSRVPPLVSDGRHRLQLRRSSKTTWRMAPSSPRVPAPPVDPEAGASPSTTTSAPPPPHGYAAAALSADKEENGRLGVSVALVRSPSTATGRLVHAPHSAPAERRSRRGRRCGDLRARRSWRASSSRDPARGPRRVRCPRLRRATTGWSAGACPPIRWRLRRRALLHRLREASLVETAPTARPLRPTPAPEGERGARSRSRAPSRRGYISRDQVAALLRRLGKRLCLEDERVTACRGDDRTRLPYGDTPRWRKARARLGVLPLRRLHATRTPRHVAGPMNDPRLNQLPNTVARTGAFAWKCSNGLGQIFDMVGNLHEGHVARRRFGATISTRTSTGTAAPTARPPGAWRYHDYSTGFGAGAARRRAGARVSRGKELGPAYVAVARAAPRFATNFVTVAHELLPVVPAAGDPCGWVHGHPPARARRRSRSCGARLRPTLRRSRPRVPTRPPRALPLLHRASSWPNTEQANVPGVLAGPSVSPRRVGGRCGRPTPDTLRWPAPGGQEIEGRPADERRCDRPRRHSRAAGCADRSPSVARVSSHSSSPPACAHPAPLQETAAHVSVSSAGAPMVVLPAQGHYLHRGWAKAAPANAIAGSQTRAKSCSEQTSCPATRHFTRGHLYGN